MSASHFSNYTKQPKGIFLLILLVLVSFTNTNNKELQYPVNNPTANKVIHTVFKKKAPSQYTLFSIEDTWFLIIERKHNEYIQHFVCINKNNDIKTIESNVIKENLTVLNRAFNKNIYHQNYIDLNAGFYTVGRKFSTGKPTYFCYKDTDGKIYGEASLTTVIQPNPIDLSVYGFLLDKLSNYIKTKQQE
ncbi:hypothetical protein [Tenacibaculum amylolyticum]|uniref:hypothetical protein n=1 Tax=Tenacibaculum amylolyticum TaxID=104269 RepID=UPI003893D76A